MSAVPQITEYYDELIKKQFADARKSLEAQGYVKGARFMHKDYLFEIDSFSLSAYEERPFASSTFHVLIRARRRWKNGKWKYKLEHIHYLPELIEA